MNAKRTSATDFNVITSGNDDRKSIPSTRGGERNLKNQSRNYQKFSEDSKQKDLQIGDDNPAETHNFF